MKPTESSLEMGSADARETVRIGRQLGALLDAGDWIGLTGDLGAGKTCLTQGLALGLDVDPKAAVTSPTFVIVQTYPGRHPLHHLDLYRLSEYEDLFEIGYEDLLASEGVCVVEWADRIPASTASDGLMITIRIRSASERRLAFQALGARGAALLDRLGQTRDGA